MRYKMLNGMELPSFLEIEIEVEDDNTKAVYVNSKIHKPSRSKMTWTYDADYSDHRILNDPRLINSVCGRYGIRVVTKFEVS